MIGFPSLFFGVPQVEVLNQRGKKAGTWLPLHMNQIFVPVLSWVQVCHCSKSIFEWWSSKIWRAFERIWNISKLIRGMQSQNKHCTCSFLFSPFSWMFFLSKVCSLQLKFFSWCWLDMKYLLLFKPLHLLNLGNLPIWGFPPAGQFFTYSWFRRVRSFPGLCFTPTSQVPVVTALQKLDFFHLEGENLSTNGCSSFSKHNKKKNLRA